MDSPKRTRSTRRRHSPALPSLAAPQAEQCSVPAGMNSRQYLHQPDSLGTLFVLLQYPNALGCDECKLHAAQGSARVPRNLSTAMKPERLPPEGAQSWPSTLKGVLMQVGHAPSATFRVWNTCPSTP